MWLKDVTLNAGFGVLSRRDDVFDYPEIELDLTNRV